MPDTQTSSPFQAIMLLLIAITLITLTVMISNEQRTPTYRVETIPDSGWITFGSMNEGCEIVSARRALDETNTASYEVILKCRK